MSFPPSFHTARLTFVPMNADLHAAAIFETRGCEHVMKYSINHAPDPSVAETHAWASKYNHFDGPPTSININDNISPIGYVIQERLPVPASSSSPLNNTISDTTTTTKQAKTDVKFGPPQNQDRIIGMTGLGLNTSPLTPNSPERRWELGYGFHPSAWGRGIATEVVRGWIRAVGEEGLLGFAFSSSSSSSSSSNTGSASGSGSTSGSSSDGTASGSTSGSPSTGTDTVSDSVNGSTAEGKMKIKPVLAACTDARNEASMRVLEKCGFVRTGEFLDSEGRGNFEFEYRF